MKDWILPSARPAFKLVSTAAMRIEAAGATAGTTSHEHEHQTGGDG
jgi:hypothetical protein